jgi:hypothetical protein
MRRSSLALAIVSALVVAACYGSPPGPGSGDDDDPPDDRPDAGGGGGGGGPDAAPANPFDKTVFTTVIQPMIDEYGCSVPGCHGGGLGGFMFTPNATGAALDANFDVVTARNPLPDPDNVYFKATNAHIGSRVLSEEDAQAFKAWVDAGSGS